MSGYDPSTYDPSVEDLATFVNVFDRDEDVISRIGNRSVAVIHAFSDSITIPKLGIRDLVDRFDARGGLDFQYRWIEDLPRRVRKKDTAFVRDGVSHNGMVCIACADFAQLKEEAVAMQKLLHLFGLRMTGPTRLHEDEEVENSVRAGHRYTKQSITSLIATGPLGNIFGKLTGVSATVRSRAEDSVGGETVARQKVSGGAIRSMMMIDALCRNMGLPERQPMDSVSNAGMLTRMIRDGNPEVWDQGFQDDFVLCHERDAGVVRRKMCGYLENLYHKVDVYYRTQPEIFKRTTTDMDASEIETRHVRNIDRTLAMIRDVEKATLDKAPEVDILRKVDILKDRLESTFDGAEEDGKGVCGVIRHCALLHAALKGPKRIMDALNDGRIRMGEDVQEKEERLLDRARRGGINGPKALEARMEAERREMGRVTEDDEDGLTMH